jgi:DnaJ family protein A protein 5
LFTSKTKLFVHIKESGHALAVPADDDDDGSGSGGKNDGKKGRKSKR